MTSLLNIAGNIPVSAAAGGQSLRFENGDNAYLSWTPPSVGSSLTQTLSFWMKRTTEGNYIFRASEFYLYLLGDNLNYYDWRQGANGLILKTSAVYRDVSAWMHVVLTQDRGNATASNRIKLYVNGEQITSFSTATYPNQNEGSYFNNSGNVHYMGGTSANYYDGYLANVTFIDGTALDPTSFGEYDGTLWKPKSDADITSLTFGTNGFYLPFKQTTEAEGFSTVTYTGNGGTQGIEGVGFEPDLVWIKARNFAGHHVLVDSVRGTFSANRYGRLFSNTTVAEDVSSSDTVTSLDADGFGVNSAGSGSYVNDSGDSYVAWCWDAGSGSAASNTDGDITSTVKANTAKGFSIISWDAQTTGSKTIGHGLSAKPELILIKSRNQTNPWIVYDKTITATKFLQLQSTAAATTNSTVFDDTEPTTSVFTIGSGYTSGNYGVPQISYAFHSVSGYSSIGSYSGTGVSGNSITGLGFKPAFILVKRTDSAGNWVIFDNTRSPVNTADNAVSADLSDREYTSADGVGGIDFDSDGFTLQDTHSTRNASGGTYIYMAFKDTRDATFFGDTSGNGNNWTPNALNNTDVMLDAPVSGGNFASWNPISPQASSTTFSEGNLKALIPASTANGKVMPTMGVSSGKWYWEYYYSVSNGNYLYVGITDPSAYTNNSYWIRGSDGETFKYENGTNSTGSGTTHRHTQGDIIQVAFDADNGKWYVGTNGTWSLSGDPVAGTGYVHNNIVSGEYGAFAANATSSNTQTVILNTGADSSFAGNATPQGNTDDNGVGDFYYAPPSGFLALTTGNLPAATITAPDEYFNTVLYSGNNADRNIDVGFQSDFIWIKERTGTAAHRLYDSIRGNGQTLFSNLTNAEFDGTGDGIYFSYSDGFAIDVGSNVQSYNETGDTYVAWNWLANGTGVSNTDGTITSTVSANQTAGFSIQTWTGDASGNATVGHGLSQAPEMIIIKPRTEARHWLIWHKAFNDYDKAMLFDTGLPADNRFGPNAPTSTVYGLYSGQGNRNGTDFVGYAFHSVEGYSKIGSYTGNGSTDGTFVHCGFRPAWVMVKRTDSAADWLMFDAKRDIDNEITKFLYPNLGNAEATGSGVMDFLSNGFKLRGSTANRNASGGSYIFLAFAEAPFKSANAR